MGEDLLNRTKVVIGENKDHAIADAVNEAEQRFQEELATAVRNLQEQLEREREEALLKQKLVIATIVIVMIICYHRHSIRYSSSEISVGGDYTDFFQCFSLLYCRFFNNGMSDSNINFSACIQIGR